MTAAEPQGAPPDIAQLINEAAAAYQGEDDRLTILLTSQLLPRAELTPAQRLRMLKLRALARHRHAHFAGSADDWSRVVELDPADRAAFVSRAGCEYGLKNYRVALDDLLAVETRFGAPNADELIWRGACLYGLEDVAGARRELRAAGALQPENQTIWRWRAAISQPYNDELPTSLEEVVLAMAALPETADMHYRHARILDALGRRPEAIAASGAALGLEPERIDLLQYRAELRLEAGDLDGALPDLLAAAALSPDNIDIQKEPVVVLRKLGRLDEALAAADGLVKAFGDWSSAYRLKADVLSDMGDKAGTLAALRAAWNVGRWDRDLGCRIAALLREAGDLEEAHEILDRMHRSYFTRPVAQALFEVMCEWGLYREALEVAGQIIRADPASADAYRQRAKLLSARGRVREARADLKAADDLDAAGPAVSEGEEP